MEEGEQLMAVESMNLECQKAFSKWRVHATITLVDKGGGSAKERANGSASLGNGE